MLAYCSSAAPLFSLQSFYNYARGHCEAAQASDCSGVFWEEGMRDGRVLVLQDVGTLKSLHWRCEMWVDCFERKRSAKLPWSATAPCTFAAVCMCVCICTSMRLYTCVCVCACMFVHRLWVLVSVLQRVDGVMHVHVFSCACVCVCICV